jgi:hypothetical protein
MSDKKIGLGVFLPRQKHIERIEEESDFFFERLEDLGDTFLKNFYSQVICCVIGDVNDFCGSLQSKNNIFYNSLKALDKNSARAIYKATGMYHTIHYLASGTYKGKDPLDMLEGFRRIFALNEQECKSFSHFAGVFCQCEARFEAEFSRYAADRIFGRSDVGQSALAYINYYFANSYRQFIEANQNYVA